MSDHRPTHPRPIAAGDLVRTPAGREARVLAVDQRLGEAHVELLPARACFRLAHLRLDRRSVAEPVILHVEPAKEGEA